VSGHEHHWQTTAHLDGCHWYTNVYGCTRCRATANATVERDFRGDPFSAIWMQPMLREVIRDECGRFLPKAERRWDEVPCARCDEIKAGAPIKRTLVIIGKDGEVESEEETVSEQREPEEAA
jgi:hypothetical protein